MTFDELYKIIEERKSKPSKGSYVTSLMRQGDDAVIQKLGEESVETVIAAKNNNSKQIIAESSDLIFHLFVMLAYFDIPLDDILKELEARKK